MSRQFASRLLPLVSLLLLIAPSAGAQARIEQLLYQEILVSATLDAPRHRLFLATQDDLFGGEGVAIVSTTGSSLGGVDLPYCRPRSLAYNPTTDRLYVVAADNALPTTSPGDVYVVDPTAKTLLATIGVGNNPASIAANPKSSRIYVTNFGSDSVTAIIGSTNAVTTIPVGDGPSAIAINPVTNRIYVANYLADTLTVIDGSTHAVITTLTTGDKPAAIAVNPVTNRFYVGAEGSQSLQVFDGSNNSLINALTVGTDVRDVAVDPVRNRIYAVSYDAQNLSVVNGSTHAVTWISTATWGSPFGLALDTTSQRLWIAVDEPMGGTPFDLLYEAVNGTVTSFSSDADRFLADPVTGIAVGVRAPSYAGEESRLERWSVGSTSTTTAAGDGAAAVATNPVTGRTFVANVYADTVSVYDSANALLATVSVGDQPVSIAVNPVTNKVYVGHAGTTQVAVIDGATNGRTWVTAGGPIADLSVDPMNNQIWGLTASGSVTRIDGATAVPTVYPLPVADLREIEADSLRNRAYLTSAAGFVISISAWTGAILTEEIGTSPWGVAVFPGSHVWVTDEAGDAVYRLWGDDLSILDTETGSFRSPRSIVADRVRDLVFVGVETTDGASGMIRKFPSDIYGNNAWATLTDYAGTLAVSEATGRVYVIESRGFSSSRLSTLEEGKVVGTKSIGLGASGIAVDPLRGLVRATNSIADTLTTIHERPAIGASPLVTTISAVPGNVTTDDTPYFSFSATSGFSPTAPSIGRIWWAVDELDRPFQPATWDFIGGGYYTNLPQLLPGMHTLYAFATDGMDGDAMQPRNAAVVGRIASVTFLVDPPCPSFVFSQQPAPASVCQGNPASLTANTSFLGPITWRWKKDGGWAVEGNGVSGSNSRFLSLDGSSWTQSGLYRAVAIDWCGNFHESNEVAVTVSAIPTEPTALQATKGAGGNVSLSWTAPPQPGSGITYDVIRSGWVGNFVDGSFATCVGSNLAGTNFIDSVPSAFGIDYYLVRAEAACGASPAGSDSGGNPIPARNCP